MEDGFEGHDFLWKVVVIGDSGVGKSNLIDRYTKDQFREETKTTIGVEFGHKQIKVDGKDIKAQIWDTAGQERFRALTRGYYRGAMGALLVYSVTNRASFDNCDPWLEELIHHADPGIIVMLVGNKTDMTDQRDVTTEEGTEFARKNNLHFVETSAKDSTNVSEAFERLIRAIYKQHVTDTPIGVDPSTPLTTTGTVVELHKEKDGEDGKKKDDDCQC